MVCACTADRSHPGLQAQQAPLLSQLLGERVRRLGCGERMLRAHLWTCPLTSAQPPSPGRNPSTAPPLSRGPWHLPRGAYLTLDVLLTPVRTSAFLFPRRGTSCQVFTKPFPLSPQSHRNAAKPHSPAAGRSHSLRYGRCGKAGKTKREGARRRRA